MPNGYLTNAGYMGYVDTKGKFILFATEEEYYEFLKKEIDLNE